MHSIITSGARGQVSRTLISNVSVSVPGDDDDDERCAPCEQVHQSPDTLSQVIQLSFAFNRPAPGTFILGARRLGQGKGYPGLQVAPWSS